MFFALFNDTLMCLQLIWQVFFAKTQSVYAKNTKRIQRKRVICVLYLLQKSVFKSVVVQNT